MLITNDIINAGMSRNGGWSLKQIQTLGARRFHIGWKYDLIGKDVEKEKIDRFLALKDIHLIVE